MKVEYYVHCNYSVQGGHETFDGALTAARIKAKEEPGSEVIVSRSISWHKAVAEKITMYEGRPDANSKS